MRISGRFVEQEMGNVPNRCSLSLSFVWTMGNERRFLLCSFFVTAGNSSFLLFFVLFFFYLKQSLKKE
jgi:hypothetical protein